MNNVKKIETFLNKLCNKHGKNANDPHQDIGAKIGALMEVVKERAVAAGDETVSDFFTEVLSTLVAEEKDGPIKDMYSSTLEEFKKELKLYLN